MRGSRSASSIFTEMLSQASREWSAGFSIELSERKSYSSALMRVQTTDLLLCPARAGALRADDNVPGGYCAMGGGAPPTGQGEWRTGVEASGDAAAKEVAILDAAL
jgi:hypothetical protein